ncbi:MAG: TetR/AcrR family transcriptional regulator [Clostridia bacterium]|nr:TetR/AcrR family transcriptional regulator [Clostridia bacterium]
MPTETLRDRLIVAGIDEISTHGIKNFSLRRVAAVCNTSCAAPYKHFKNKDELVGAIIEYINSKWALLRDSIISLYSDSTEKQLLEISVSYIRFCVANPSFHSVLSESGDALELRALGIEEILSRFSSERGYTPESRELLEFSLKAILFGTVTMIDSKEAKNEPHTFELVRHAIRTAISEVR